MVVFNFNPLHIIDDSVPNIIIWNIEIGTVSWPFVIVSIARKFVLTMSMISDIVLSWWQMRSSSSSGLPSDCARNNVSLGLKIIGDVKPFFEALKPCDNSFWFLKLSRSSASNHFTAWARSFWRSNDRWRRNNDALSYEISWNFRKDWFNKKLTSLQNLLC